MSFAKSLANSGLKIAILEKQTESAISAPAYDGREIALTHQSYALLQRLGILAFIPHSAITKIKDAKVQDGNSPYVLHFDHVQAQCEHLGYMVSNQQIRQACYAAIADEPHITLMSGLEVVAITPQQQGHQVTLSNHQQLSARLVIAADSRFSAARRMMGIATEMLDFGRVCIVCTMQTEHAHDETAYEMFHYDQTLAVLPLSDHRVSVVITADT